MKKQIILTSAIALCTTFNSIAMSDDKKLNIIDSMPFASAISLNKQEFVDGGQITDGELGSLSYTQSIHFNHALKKHFAIGVFVKGSYSFSDDTQRYWENVTETGYGLEIVKSFSNDLASWGQIKLTIGKTNHGHHDPIGKPFDADLKKISLSVSTSGDLIK